MSSTYPFSTQLKKTPFFALHDQVSAKMVSFAGFEMPIQYPGGIMAEHAHTRNHASLFDVSHMGHIRLHGIDMIEKFEYLVAADLRELAVGSIKYGLLTNAEGGVIDDLMITREEGGLYLVVNASRQYVDLAHIQSHLGKDRVEHLADRALLALQGPKAGQVMAGLSPDAAKLKFMQAWYGQIDGLDVQISRSGYTGEDGFEITCRPRDAVKWVDKFLAGGIVQWAGLGARDTLRLEAGLCLYGQELTETITPVEADLKWALGKRRRAEGHFLGEETIRRQLQTGVARQRVGIKMTGRHIARGHAAILDASGKTIGEITSGTFSPTLQAPIAMGYVDTAHAKPGTNLQIVIRDQPQPAVVATLPFVPYRYYRG